MVPLDCATCGDPLRDRGPVCARCGSAVVRLLELAAHLAGEAAITISRQDRRGELPGVGFRPPDEGRAPNALRPTGSPANLDAARTHDAAIRVLLDVARLVARERAGGVPLGAGRPGGHPTATLALWLVQHVKWMRRRPDGAGLLAAITDACHSIESAVDRPLDRWYAGRCDVDGCTLDLTPVSGATMCTCRCGARHDLAGRRAELLVRADDVLGGAAWCALMLTRLGVPLNPSTLRTWAQRGRLPVRGRDAAGRALYRLGDVRAAVVDQAARDIVNARRAAIQRAHRTPDHGACLPVDLRPETMTVRST